MTSRAPGLGADSARALREQLARSVDSALGADSRVVGAYLFGSTASGEARAGSDVDLGLLFGENVGLRDLVELQTRLEEELGRPIDVIDAGRCDPFLALEIVRGERIFCRDSDRCDEFDLYVLRRAGDLEPFERERRRLVLEPASPRP